MSSFIIHHQRVKSKVTGRTETASEGVAAESDEVVVDSSANASEGNSGTPLIIISVAAAVAGIGGAGYYFMKKRK